jgi:hypothetical protein
MWRAEEKLDRYVAALYELAKYFDNCYVVDIYNYGPIYDEKFRSKFFLHGHMNPSGYLFTAKMIDSYIDYIVRHDPDNFKQIGFVGTDINYEH